MNQVSSQDVRFVRFEKRCLLAVSSTGASLSTLVWIGVICAAEVFGLWLEELDD